MSIVRTLTSPGITVRQNTGNRVCAHSKERGLTCSETLKSNDSVLSGNPIPRYAFDPLACIRDSSLAAQIYIRWTW